MVGVGVRSEVAMGGMSDTRDAGTTNGLEGVIQMAASEVVLRKCWTKGYRECSKECYERRAERLLNKTLSATMTCQRIHFAFRRQLVVASFNFSKRSVVFSLLFRTAYYETNQSELRETKTSNEEHRRDYAGMRLLRMSRIEVKFFWPLATSTPPIAWPRAEPRVRSPAAALMA